MQADLCCTTSSSTPNKVRAIERMKDADMKKKKISVMIPCYNEEENARPIYEAVRDELRKSCPDYEYEILFIDNKSQDCTRKIIEQICTEDKHVKAIFNSKNFGQFNSPFYAF